MGERLARADAAWVGGRALRSRVWDGRRARQSSRCWRVRERGRAKDPARRLASGAGGRGARHAGERAVACAASEQWARADAREGPAAGGRCRLHGDSGERISDSRAPGDELGGRWRAWRGARRQAGRWPATESVAVGGGPGEVLGGGRVDGRRRSQRRPRVAEARSQE